MIALTLILPIECMSSPDHTMRSRWRFFMNVL
jgi:hypothetical protein